MTLGWRRRWTGPPPRLGQGGHLQPLRGVHRVAHRGVVAASPQRPDQDLAGVDPDAHLHRHVGVDLGPVGGQRLLHAQRGPHGSLRVVLVGHRGSEEGDDGVAHDLVDLAAERGHVTHEQLEAVVDQVLDLLGIGRLAERRVAHEVGEDHGCDPALVRPGDQRLPAGRAEACALGGDGSTARAGHPVSIRADRRRAPG